jgi:HlyD family secretion protein
MFPRRLSLFLAATALVACQKEQKKADPLPTAEVTRGDIAVRVQATGAVTPINPVDIKSKAAGAIVQEPVEVGSLVKQGDLLSQIDPRDVKAQFDQAVADDVVSSASLQQALRVRIRQDTLFARKVITAAANDSSTAQYAAAVSDMVSKRAALDLKRQALEDATVRAPIGGTVVSRPTSVGQIITSTTTSPNGGTTLMTVADLGRVRMLVTIDEVEMGNIRVGLPASVAVDAFPNRTFDGVLEKIEPQAVVTQGVTFFPVEVTISNKEGLLLPGMNGEVTIRAADLKNVLQVPIDAIRATNELAPVARMFSIPIDTLMNSLRRDLVSTEGKTGIPGRYAVVAKADGTYEMRLVRIGPSDLKVVQVTDGLKEGDTVVSLGAILAAKPEIAPVLAIANDMKRGATASRATEGGQLATPAGAPASAPAKTDKPQQQAKTTKP